MKLLNRKGQAAAEMALFGTIILFVVSVLIAYVQKLNDQQISKMESFRRALQKATTYQGAETESAGASVQYLQVEHRRHADLAAGFAKGVTETIASDASVYWAIPTARYYDGLDNAAAKDLQLAQINDDEVPSPGLPNEFYINTESGNDSEPGLTYSENTYKGEDGGSTKNLKTSSRRETVTTKLPNKEIQQFSYRAPDGQYRYYSNVPGSARNVEKRLIWQTPQ